VADNDLCRRQGHREPGGCRPASQTEPNFFPNVLADSEFQRKGVLFGSDPTLAIECQWVVVDPNRHKLVIWQKPLVSSDFVECGKALRASVVTNGPLIHSRYEKQFDTPLIGGLLTKAYSGAGYLGAITQGEAEKLYISGIYNTFRAYDVLERFVYGPQASEERVNVMWKKAAADEAKEKQAAEDRADLEWFVTGPYGDIVGKDGSSPNTARAGNTIDVKVGGTGLGLGYFGRNAGTSFESYEIGKDNPAGLTEASGGLYTPELLGGKSYPTSHTSNMWFYWGLAPLKPPTPDNAGLKNALDQFAKAPGCKALTGLIVGLYLHDKPANVSLLANVGVTDAVRLDGGDSVLFGYDDTVLVGTGMSRHKRMWLQYGLAFFPV